MSSNSTKSREDRKAEMEAKKAELDKWLSDNGIDQQYAYLVMGGGHMGRGGMDRPGDAPNSTEK